MEKQPHIPAVSEEQHMISVIDIGAMLGNCPNTDTEDQHKHSNYSQPGEFHDENDPGGLSGLCGRHGNPLNDKPIVADLCDSASPRGRSLLGEKVKGIVMHV